MNKIEQTAIVGMGALGLLFGSQIARSLGDDKIYFVADEERVARYQNMTFTINGKKTLFEVRSQSEATVVDLVIVATKYNHLDAALEVMKNCVGKDTTIISIINGISSEKIIGARYGKDKVLHTVAQGMDAVKIGSDFQYTHPGELRIGIIDEVQRKRLEQVVTFFEKAQIPYTVDADIIHRMWGKYMLNVGLNQVCMLYEATYGEVLGKAEAFDTMCKAMREVMALARAEGVNLTEQDLNYYLDLMRTLVPDATPSMRQDGILKRYSEVEMFAGTIIELGAKHNIPVPVNQMLYKKVKEKEAAY